jgi:hypothetical protein
MSAATYRLTRDTWHGYTRPAGTILTPCDSPTASDSNARDEHGCAASWYRDPNGNLINAWNCEVSA